MTKYLPRFKPEVYLRFLNNVGEFNLYANLYYDLENEESRNQDVGYGFEISCDDGASMMIEGNSIEECLDQAILATRFERDL